MGKTFLDINQNIFLDQPPKVQEIRAKINKWKSNQTQKLLHSQAYCKKNLKAFQQPRYGNSPRAHQQMTDLRRCGYIYSGYQ